jgi:diguanylate cyclase (GGDEF)-like protein/excisionase family DNA binding protein
MATSACRFYHPPHGTYQNLQPGGDGRLRNVERAMVPATADPLLSVSQAARLLGVHPNTIRAWTDSGRLTAYRINERGDRRYRRSEVEALLVEDTPATAVATPASTAPPDDGDDQLARFSRVAAALSTSSLPAGVAGAAVQALREHLGVARAAVYVADSSDATLELSAAYEMSDLPPSLSVDERSTWPADRGRATLPLRAGRSVVGLLVLEVADADSLSDALRRSLTATLAAHLANARLLVRSRLEVRRARALRAVTQELTGTLDLSRVVADIVERTRTLFAADRGGIWLFEDSPHPVPLVTRNLSPAFLQRSAELTPTSRAVGVQALAQRRTLWVRHADVDPDVGEMREAYAAEGIKTACLVPLVSDGRGFGVIGLYHDRDRLWPEEELALAQAFADQAAVAIQNARLYRSVADNAARIRSINDLAGRLNRLTDVHAIGQAIVDEASTIAAYNDIRVYRVDREAGVCEPVAFTREMLDADPGETADLLTLRVGEGFTGWVAEHGEPLLINNALDDPRGKTIDGTDDVEESLLVVPMLYEGQTLGVIVLSQLGFDRFSDDDLQIMSIFAGYAAQAMANATTYGQLTAQTAELARRAESQRRLLEVNQRLLSTLDQEHVLDTIADGLRDVVEHDNVSIYRTDHTLGGMVPVLARETHAAAVSDYVIPFGLGLMGWAVEHREAVLANDALADPRAVQVPGTPMEPEAIIVVPLIADGEVLGALNMSRMGGADAEFSEADFQLVQLFAAQAAVALRNADAHHAMSKRAETDALTGLLNHGAFQRDIARAVDESADRGPLAVLMMDLDRFKAYNDRHGHPAGDELLKRIAAALRSTARTDDGVYRYGGDEFAVILPATGVEDARVVADRLRRAVAALSATDAAPVTITVGIAAAPDDGEDRATLTAAADAALYFGKRAGEDRAVLARDVPRRRRSDAPHEGRDAA